MRLGYRERKRSRSARKASAISLPTNCRCGYGPWKLCVEANTDRLGASLTSFMVLSYTRLLRVIRGKVKSGSSAGLYFVFAAAECCRA